MPRGGRCSSASSDRLVDVDVQAITTGSRSANFDLRLHDLSALAAAYHQNIGGAMSLSGKVAEQGRITPRST